MKILPKTFLYTLALLLLIALLANGIVYALMPSVYTQRKQRKFEEMTNWLVQQLSAAQQVEAIPLIAQYAARTQANLIVELGDRRYAMQSWSDGAFSQVVVGEPDNSGASQAASQETGDFRGMVTSTVIVTGADTQGGRQPNLTAIWPSLGFSSADTIETERSFDANGVSGRLFASMTLAPVDEAVGVIVSLLPISILLCIAIAVAFSFGYARAITRPILTISAETRQMTLLHPDAVCRVRARDEFADLAENINSLYRNLLSTIKSLEGELQKVGEAERTKTEFLRAASHELKTPVTALSVILDNMLLGVGRYRNHGEWLPKCRSLLDSLTGKLQEILDASRLETWEESAATVELADLCGEILSPYLLIARAKGLDVSADFSDSFAVTLPPGQLGKALSNIFSNAVQYAAPGGRVSVYCLGRSLVVENECEPIPAEQLARLREPFYQPDASRSRESGGSGLGLYIVDAILRRLDLAYRFEPMADRTGMRFSICF